MGRSDKEVAAGEEPAPPPYTEGGEHDGLPEPVPDYQAPMYRDAAGGTSTTLQTAMRKFPPTFNGYYQWSFSATYFLGRSAEDKLFAISLHSGLFSRPALTVHDGPSEKSPPLGFIKGGKILKPQLIYIHVPAMHLPQSGEAGDAAASSSSAPAATEPLIVEHDYVRGTFTVDVDGSPGSKEAKSERFQWRRTKGSEIKDLTGGRFPYGWKLVWLSGEDGGAGGKRAVRDQGVASDGKEVVAVLGFYNSLSRNKGFQFAFLGTGLMGVWGPAWEIVTVVSGVWAWYLQVCGNTSAAVASA